MPQPIEEVVIAKLDQVLRLLAMDVTNGLKQNDKIMLLNRAGFQPKEIASLLETTSNTVSVTLSGHRKAARDGKGRRKGKKTASE
jgi:predicted transcriptional regulator